MDRAEVLANRFVEAADCLIATLEGCPDDLWGGRTDAEGWSVGVVGRHVAEDQDLLVGWVRSVARGRDVPPIPPETVNQFNAEQAARNADCTKEDTIALLRQTTTSVAAMLRGLSDAQLDTRASLLAIPSLSAAEAAEFFLIGHVQEHLGSIQARLNATVGAAR